MDDKNENFGIDPWAIYRKSHKVTRRIIGLGPTQIDEAIAAGRLPPPVDVTPGGRAKGWLGRTLIDLHRARLTAAKTKRVTIEEQRAQAGRLAAQSPLHISKRK